MLTQKFRIVTDVDCAIIIRPDLLPIQLKSDSAILCYENGDWFLRIPVSDDIASQLINDKVYQLREEQG
jgi:hypothetical protein